MKKGQESSPLIKVTNRYVSPSYSHDVTQNWVVPVELAFRLGHVSKQWDIIHYNNCKQKLAEFRLAQKKLNLVKDSCFKAAMSTDEANHELIKERLGLIVAECRKQVTELEQVVNDRLKACTANKGVKSVIEKRLEESCLDAIANIEVVKEYIANGDCCDHNGFAGESILSVIGFDGCFTTDWC